MTFGNLSAIHFFFACGGPYASYARGGGWYTLPVFDPNRRNTDDEQAGDKCTTNRLLQLLNTNINFRSVTFALQQ